MMLIGFTLKLCQNLSPTLLHGPLRARYSTVDIIAVRHITRQPGLYMLDYNRNPFVAEHERRQLDSKYKFFEYG